MEVVATQVRACTSFVNDHAGHPEKVTRVLHQLSRIFAFLTVRPIAAFDLQNKSRGAAVNSLVNPYVTMNLNSTQQHSRRTNTVESTLSPTWDRAEYFFCAHPDDKVLEIHVWHESYGRDDPSLGYLPISIADIEPGKWHKKREHLTSFKKGTQKDSVIELDVFLATEVVHLM